MAENTTIEWTDHTFNPWIGCQAVSAGCAFCYAEALVNRFGGDFATRRRTSLDNWLSIIRIDRRAAKRGVRERIFCASMADVFDNQVPEIWRADLWDLIDDCPNLDWQLLTKRPQNIRAMLPKSWGRGWGHVWLGTTVEDQREADRRIPHLIAVPAQLRFLSCEPLLGPVTLTAIACPNGCRPPDYCTRCYPDDGRATGTMDVLGNGEIDWVIAGGESGSGARRMNPLWPRALRDECAGAGVPFLFKQWGEYAEGGSRVGKKAAGRELDGRTYTEFPATRWAPHRTAAHA